MPVHLTKVAWASGLKGVQTRQMKITEGAIQEALFEWAAWSMRKYPELCLLHAIPNGGYRNKIEAKNLKKQGVKAGVSDLFLPSAKHGYHGLYIELKAHNGKPSKEQAEWINRVREEGYCAAVCYGYGEAQGVLEWYLGDESKH